MVNVISETTYNKALNACDSDCESCRYVQLYYPNSFDDPFEVCPLVCKVVADEDYYDMKGGNKI